jgi:hypothetical protein
MRFHYKDKFADVRLSLDECDDQFVAAIYVNKTVRGEIRIGIHMRSLHLCVLNFPKRNRKL